MICINHFAAESIELKRNKCVLKKLVVPTIFAPNDIQIEEVNEPELHTAQTKECTEAEILFLRKRIAALEAEYGTMEKNLNEKLKSTINQNKLLTEEISRMNESNAKFETDFVRFAVNDEPQVKLAFQINNITIASMGTVQW